MKYQIVEFTKENRHSEKRFFGIRRRTFFENLFNYGGDYYDFQNNHDGFTLHNFFWKSSSVFFGDCKTTDINLLYYTHSKLTNNVISKILK